MGLRGAWRAGCAADVRIVRAYCGCASGVLVESLIVSRRPRHHPLRSRGWWRGLRRSCAWAQSAAASCWLSTPPQAEWLTLPQGQDRRSRVIPGLREWTPLSGSLAPAIQFPSRAEGLSFRGGVQRGFKEFDQQSNDSLERRGFRLWPGLPPKRRPAASLRGVSRKGWR